MLGRLCTVNVVEDLDPLPTLLAAEQKYLPVSPAVRELMVSEGWVILPPEIRDAIRLVK